MLHLPLPSPSVRRYGAACALAIAALLLQAALRPWTGGQIPFLFFTPAVAVAAGLWGRGAATLVAGAGAFNALFFYPPSHGLRLQDPSGVIVLAAYLLLSAALIYFAARVRVITGRAALVEQHLNLAQEGTGIGVYELDFLHNRAYVSPSLAQLLGHEGMPASMSLDRWLAALQADHVAETYRVLEARVACGELRYEREQRIQRPDGSIRWLLSRVRLDLAPGGALAVARGATVDITARKELDERLLAAQSELQRQVADLRQLHSLSKSLVGPADDLNAHLRAVLRFLIDYHGAAHGFLTLRRGEKPSFVTAAVQGLAAGAVSVGIDAAGADHPCSAALSAHRAFAAQLGFATAHCTPLLSNTGDATGVLAVLFPEERAITQRERELSEVCAGMAAVVIERERVRELAIDRERRFTVALESATVPFNILAPVHGDSGALIDFRWTYVNPAAAHLFRRPAEAMSGRRVMDVLPRTWENPGLLQRLASVIEHGVPCEFETQSAHRPDLWLHVIATPLLGSAAVWFSDISERKQLEQARADADRRKDEFLATLAHELRNPLAPIRQSIRIARMPAATEAQKSWSHDVIDRQIRHMALLLDDLLDVSRVSRGALLLRKSSETVQGVVDAALEVARPHIEGQGHRLELHIPDPSLALELDALRIAQVIGNLLTNAAKYTDPGGRIVLRTESDGSNLRIRILDNGVGLTPEQQGSIFDMFSQASTATGRSQGGLGIGLSLARSLVRLHGGDISVASAGLGLGSEFAVHLPRVICERAASSVPVPATPARPCREPWRILVADDNTDAADTLAAWLRIDGHEVHVAYDGEQAVEQFSRHQPQVALLDVGMPKMSGHDVARSIRRAAADRRIVMIAITGWGQLRDHREAMEAGFDHHMTKPIDPAALIKLIEEYT